VLVQRVLVFVPAPQHKITINYRKNEDLWSQYGRHRQLSFFSRGHGQLEIYASFLDRFERCVVVKDIAGIDADDNLARG